MDSTSLLHRAICFSKEKVSIAKGFIIARRSQLKKIFGSRTLLDKKIIFSLQEKKIPSFSQLKKLPKVLNRFDKILLLVFAVLFFGALTMQLGRFYLSHIAIVPDYGGIYTEGLVGKPRYINPLFSLASDVDQDLTRLVFSGLLKFDPKEGYSPDLAKDYEVSSDLKTYTFHLKEGVKWHDGQPVTADDVVFTMSAIQNSEYGSPLIKAFSGVIVEKVDDSTVKFHLQEPYLGFKQILTVGILPERVWASISPSAALLAEKNLKPIGSGSFKFKSFTRDRNGDIKSYILERNEDVYGKKPYLDRVIFKFYPNSAEAEAALAGGEVDGINFLSAKGVSKKQNIVYYSLNLPQYTAIFFNLKSGNVVLGDKLVRQALAYATNKDKILKEVLGGTGLILQGPIPRGFVGYNSEAKKYDFDLVTAGATLNKAGWEKSKEDNLRRKNNTVLEITLAVIDQGEQYHLAEILRNDWEVLGIKVNLRTVPASQVQKAVIKPRLYDALVYGAILGPESDLLPYWHSSQIDDPGLNLSGFSNALADKYLEEIRKTNNLIERAKKIIALQNILEDEAPAVFLYSPTYIYPVSKKIKGIDLQYITMPRDRLANIENWFIREKKIFIRQ